MRTSLRSLLATLTTATVLVLASACSGEPPVVDDAEPTPPPVETSAAPPAGPPECGGILFSAGEQIAGQALGDCIVAAMMLAGTGVHRVDTSDGTTSVVNTRYSPDFAMSVDGDHQVILDRETGWLHVPDHGWTQADPASADPVVVMVTSIVELARAVTDPRVLAASFATSATWTVIGDEAVPVDDATAEVAWKIVPDESMDVAGVAVSDVALWLDSDYLGVFYTGTGSYAGQSVTTTNTFLEWGGAVDIPDPTAP